MRLIKEQIKTKEFKRIYLLYGEEDYLKKLYRDKLWVGIVGTVDGMNCSRFEGKKCGTEEVMELAQTMPFFAERRLIIIENSGWFKSQSEFADFVKEIPDTTCIVFVENEVDRRNRLYKAVKEYGTIAEMSRLDEKNLVLWLASRLAENRKMVAESTAIYLLHKSGTDMNSLSNEIEKLVCYVGDRESVTKEDVDAICTTQVTGKIFAMIDAIASKQQVLALRLYYDLLSSREKPMTILYLISRHFNILLQVKELLNGGQSAAIAGKVGIPPFAVGKYSQQAKNFTEKKLKKMLCSCINTEEQVKTGHMADQMGVELLIVESSLAYESPLV